MYYCTHHLCLCTSLLALPANFPRCCSNLPLSQLANLSPVPRHNNNNDINNAFASMILPGPLTPPSKSISPPGPRMPRPRLSQIQKGQVRRLLPRTLSNPPSRPRKGGARSQGRAPGQEVQGGGMQQVQQGAVRGVVPHVLSGVSGRDVGVGEDVDDDDDVDVGGPWRG